MLTLLSKEAHVLMVVKPQAIAEESLARREERCVHAGGASFSLGVLS